MKKISVIISVYNSEKYLDECLLSLENQSLKLSDFEVIIINDGSKDNSIKIIRKYIKKHPYWILIDRENKGLSRSRNEGLDIFDSEYVTFFDSDDILEYNALEIMYNETKKSECKVGIFRTTSFTDTGIIEDSNIKTLDSLDEFVNSSTSIILYKLIRSVAIAYHKDIVNDIRFIPNVVHEDNYFCIKAYNKAKKIYISKNKVYKIRRTGDNSSSITRNLNFKTYEDLYKNICQADIEIKNPNLVKFHANQLFGYINKNLLKSERKKAMLIIRKYLLNMKRNKIISMMKYVYLIFYIEFKKNIKLH